MGRRTRIAVLDKGLEAWADQLRGEAYDVAATEATTTRDEGPPDLVLIDGQARPDVVSAVRACRRRWSTMTTSVLVLGVSDPQVSSAAIDAGATDAVADATHGPMLTAHVRRLLESGRMLRRVVAAERRQAKREALALAVADIARPLGEMIDRLESAMSHNPNDERLEELLELTTRAVDAVDRVRHLAEGPDVPEREPTG